MRVAVVQTNPRFGEIGPNIEESLALMASGKADIYILPELFNTGYNFVDRMEAESLAEPLMGRTFKALAAFARAHSCYIVYGFVEKENSLYNAGALVGPDGLLGHYRKVHLFYKETLFFEPGNLGFPVFDLPIGKVGMMICFDWFYPESARTLALKGAQIIVHPSNLVMPHCPDAMVTRCLENCVFAATANRIGTEDRGGEKLTYIGSSQIVSPKGTILTRLNNTEPGIGIFDVDLEEAVSKRINEYNDLFEGRKKSSYEL